MFTFYSPVCSEHIWKLCFKTNKEIDEIYYKDRKKEEEKSEKLKGIIEYITSTIYIDKDLDDNLFVETLRKQLMRIYLYDTGQQDRQYTEEEFCEITSVAAPLICKVADDIALRLKKGK